MPDPFRILGLAPGASQEAIKKAYRALARKYHPDSASGEASSERFLEIQAAYEALQEDGVAKAKRPQAPPKPTQRPRKRRPEHASKIPPRPGPKRRGRDITAEISISFEEVAQGARRTLPVLRRETCRCCSGRGDTPESRRITCPVCLGSGGRKKLFGREPCTHCEGRGIVFEPPCPDCKGRGTKAVERTFEITIPVGCERGAKLRHSGLGESGQGGGGDGDLVLLIDWNPHPLYQPQGLNLTLTLPLSIVDACLGGEVEVPTPHGPVKIEIPPGTQHGQSLRVRGRGLPARKKRPGDLFVRVDLEVPSSITQEQRELLTKLRFTSAQLPRREAMERAARDSGGLKR